MKVRERRPAWIFAMTALTITLSWAIRGRADAPPGRYTLTNDTVYDTKTKLTWQRNTHKCAADMGCNWTDADAFCKNPGLDGKGWRLPSMKELQTLVDETRLAPSIDRTAFPDTVNGYYWTSSLFMNSSASAWFVDFDFGDAGADGIDVKYNVRCVRSP